MTDLERKEVMLVKEKKEIFLFMSEWHLLFKYVALSNQNRSSLFGLFLFMECLNGRRTCF